MISDEEDIGVAEIFLRFSKAAIIAPEDYRDWLYLWPKALENPPEMDQVIATLRDRIDEGGTDEVLYRYAILGPLFLDGRDEEAARVIAGLEAESPYLAASARSMLAAAARHLGLGQRWRKLRSSIDGGNSPPLPYATLARAYDPIIAERLDAANSIRRVTSFRAQPFRTASLLTAEGIARANRAEEAAETLRRHLNNATWALATDETLVDPDAALDGAALMRELGSPVIEIHQRDTIAAAYARAGDFERAVLWQRWAIADIAAKPKSDRRDRRLADYGSRLERYLEGRPAVDVEAGALEEEVVARGDGSVEARGHVDGPGRVGLWRFFADDGRTVRQGYYRQGILIGPWTRYDDDGRPIRRAWHYDGVESGPLFEYAGGTRIAERHPVSDDDGQGPTHTSRRWTPDGVLVEAIPWREHRVHGVYRAWYDDGAAKIRGHCDEGEPIGTWSLWGEGGELRRVPAGELDDGILP